MAWQPVPLSYVVDALRPDADVGAAIQFLVGLGVRTLSVRPGVVEFQLPPSFVFSVDVAAAPGADADDAGAPLPDGLCDSDADEAPLPVAAEAAWVDVVAPDRDALVAAVELLWAHGQAALGYDGRRECHGATVDKCSMFRRNHVCVFCHRRPLAVAKRIARIVRGPEWKQRPCGFDAKCTLARAHELCPFRHSFVVGRHETTPAGHALAMLLSLQP
jgi:hypothetical protein